MKSHRGDKSQKAECSGIILDAFCAFTRARETKTKVASHELCIETNVSVFFEATQDVKTNYQPATFWV
jgi:hypothetical protein